MDLCDDILEIGSEILGSQDLELASKHVCEIISKKFEIDFLGIFRVEKDNNVSLLYGHGLRNEDGLFNISLLSVWESTAGEAVREGTPVVKDIKEDTLIELLGENLEVYGIPLVSSKGVKGVIVLLTKKDRFEWDRIIPVIQSMALPLTSEIVNSELYSQLEDLFLSTILALASAIDAKHPYTRGHSERVTRYSIAVAKEMGLDREEIKYLRISALLHDIGKIGIREAVLDKKGRLTEEEYEEIKRHPIIGAQIVSKIANCERIIPGIIDHHERYDGTGYPNGKKGEEISLFGRIIAVADAFDAMTSTRSYRKAVPFQLAVEEIVDNAGYQFDPKIVKYFVQVYEKEKEIWQRENIMSLA